MAHTRGRPRVSRSFSRNRRRPFRGCWNKIRGKISTRRGQKGWRSEVVSIVCAVDFRALWGYTAPLARANDVPWTFVGARRAFARPSRDQSFIFRVGGQDGSPRRWVELDTMEYETPTGCTERCLTMRGSGASSGRARARASEFARGDDSGGTPKKAPLRRHSSLCVTRTLGAACCGGACAPWTVDTSVQRQYLDFARSKVWKLESKVSSSFQYIRN